MNKKRVVYLLLIVMFCQLVSIQESSAATKDKEIGFSTKKITVTEGKKINIRLKKTTKKVKWKVTNKKVVKLIRKKGKRNNIITIKGKKKGTCRITAKCGKKKYSIKVIVKPKGANISNSNKKIEAKVVKNVISKTDDLEIIVKNTGKETYYISYEPGRLERKEGSNYVELKLKNNIKWIETALILCSGQEKKINIPINAYYESVTSGNYRYTKKIGKENVSVEFKID